MSEQGAPRRRPRRYRLYAVGELLMFILEASDDYPLQLVENTLVHRRAQKAVRVDVMWYATRYRAMILTRTSDWYRFSLHLYAQSEVELLIVGTHDSCVPLPVLSFDALQPEETREGVAIKYPSEDGKGVYAISSVPKAYEPKQLRWNLATMSETFRRTEYGHAMLVGGLMCKLPEADQRLAAITSKYARLRVNREVTRLHHRRPGRPIKIEAWSHASKHT
jgi:hypothetical protein